MLGNFRLSVISTWPHLRHSFSFVDTVRWGCSLEFCDDYYRILPSHHFRFLWFCHLYVLLLLCFNLLVFSMWIFIYFTVISCEHMRNAIAAWTAWVRHFDFVSGVDRWFSDHNCVFSCYNNPSCLSPITIPRISASLCLYFHSFVVDMSLLDR